jgi:hypothetical protein
MFKQFVGIELDQEEVLLIEAWFVQNYKTNALSQENLRKFFLVDLQHKTLGGGNPALAKETIHKVKKSMESKFKPFITELEKF